MTQDPTDKLVAAFADVARLQSGWRPAEADMGDMAFLDNWTLVRDPRDGQPTLVGKPAGHPRLVNSNAVATSPVVWISVEERLARTVNRFYRLGTPSRQMQAAMDVPEEETPTPGMGR